MDRSYKNKGRGGAFRKFNGNLDDNEDEEARLDKEIPSLQNPYFRMPCAVAGCKYVELFSKDGYSKHIISHYDEEKIKKNNTCKRCKVYISSRRHFDRHVKKCNVLFPTRVVSDEPDKEDIPTASSESSLTFSRCRRRLSKSELKRKWLKFENEGYPIIKEILENIKDEKTFKANIIASSLLVKLTEHKKVYLETVQKQIFPVRNVTLNKDALDRMFSGLDVKPSISTSIAPKSDSLLQKDEQLLYLKTEPPDNIENLKEEVEQVMDVHADEDIKPPVLRLVGAAKTDSSLTNITNNMEGFNMEINQRDIKQPILDILATTAVGSGKVGGLYGMKSPVISLVDIKGEDNFSSVSGHINKLNRPNKKDASLINQNFPIKVEPEVNVSPKREVIKREIKTEIKREIKTEIKREIKTEIKREIKTEPTVKVEPVVNNRPKRKRGPSESSKSRNGGKVYDCDQCDYATMEQGNFKRHIGTHIKAEIKQEPQSSRRNRKSEKPLVQCKLCPFASKETGNFSRHMSTHGIPERNSVWYNCKVPGCGFKGKGYNAINFHTLREHNISSMHDCDICSASYKTSVELKEHRYEHAYEKADEKLFSEVKPKSASGSTRRSGRKR